MPVRSHLHTLLSASVLLCGLVLNDYELLASDAPAAATTPAFLPLQPAVMRPHRGQFNGQSVRYQSIYEEFLVDDSKGQTLAILSTISYVAETSSANPQRPVLFVFQGGPGSSAIWAHLGLLGPKRVRFDDPARPSTLPPFALEANPHSLLDVADLVFIDPVYTGFSRPWPGTPERALLNSTADAQAVARVITQWLGRHQRWNVPRYVMGSSYGTTRAILVAEALMGGVLPPQGRLGAVTLNGLILLGPTFGRQAVFAGNHRALQTLLPTQAATAWYHGRLDDQWDGVEVVAEAARQFAWAEYGQALDAGYNLSPERATAVARRLQELTGIEAETWLNQRLRIDMDDFRRLLLVSEARQIGRFDSRFTLPMSTGLSDPVADDPAMAQYTPAFVATFNAYLASELGLHMPIPYVVIDWQTVNFGWDYGWGPGIQRPRNDAEILARVQRRTPELRIFVGAGYYDLGTPFAEAEYALAQVPLDRERLRFEIYPSGHSPYLGAGNTERLAQDIRRFVAP